MQAEAMVFKVLADATRLRLAVLLAVKGETCVCVLAEALKAQPFKISRHLSVMRSAGLVEVRREGTWMYYRLAKARSRLEECLYECFRDCLAEHGTARMDLKRLVGAACKPK